MILRRSIALVVLVAALAAHTLGIAADGGQTALPRREDITYRMPGVSEISTALLSWSTKIRDFTSSVETDSLTPSVWVNGPVYGGVTWFWKETPPDAIRQDGEISFVGFAASQDTVTYDPPVRWLPLDPATEGTWETTTTSSKGETWTFRFQYAGQVDVQAGSPSNPQDIPCWKLRLEQLAPPALVGEGSQNRRDGMGILHPADLQTKAWTDSLYYQADELPRRRIWYQATFAQNELLYLTHTTRDTPVPSEGTGVGGFKARFRK